MKVLFVNMPFSSIRPAIGVSLLKGHLDRIGVSSEVAYLNLRFVRMLGAEAYVRVSDVVPNQLLLGDWIFAPCLFPGLRDERPFLDMMRRRFPAVGPDGSSLSDCIPDVLRARRLADPFLNECLGALDWGAYDLIGFSTSFSQNLASLALARRLRDAFPRTTIVFGGANCEGEMGLQLHRSFPFVDFVCSGEADRSFPELVRRLIEGRDIHGIPGVISRGDGESYYSSLLPERVEDLDSLPYPHYDDYFEQHRREGLPPGLPWVVMETSRGCWWGEKSHCTFCGLNGLSMRYRAKTQQRALDEILYLTRTYQTPYVEMVDNILDMHYFHELLPELRRRRISLQMFYETKANLTKEQVQLLRDAGVTIIQPGIESFSLHVLRLMRKGTSPMQNIQLLKWCKEFGIACNWNVLYGFPGEDPSDYRQMALLVAGLHHFDPPTGWGPVRLDRFSPHFVGAEQFGLCNVRPDRSYHFVYDLPQESLTNLAYYFEHDYADGRDPEQYTAGLKESLERWTLNADRSGLVYLDSGTDLSIEDFRVGSALYRTILHGPERALYLYCDQNRSKQQVMERAAQLDLAETQTDDFLGRMTEQQLMVHADGRYLSLAVPAVSALSAREDPPHVEMSDEELRSLRARLDSWSETLTPRERASLQQMLGSERLVGAETSRGARS